MNLYHCYFVHCKSYQELPAIKPRPRDDTLRTNRLSYVAALHNSKIT